MARQKQTAPSQRATSSELMHLLPNGAEAQQKQRNGAPQEHVANGTVSEKNAPEAAPEAPGLTQLAICVLGIYASLYVHLSVLEPNTVKLTSKVFPGVSSKKPSPPSPTLYTLPLRPNRSLQPSASPFRSC